MKNHGAQTVSTAHDSFYSFSIWDSYSYRERCRYILDVLLLSLVSFDLLDLYNNPLSAKFGISQQLPQRTEERC